MNDSTKDMLRLVLKQDGMSQSEIETTLITLGAKEKWVGSRDAAEELGISHAALHRWRTDGIIRTTNTTFPDEIFWRVTPAGHLEYEVGSIRRWVAGRVKKGPGKTGHNSRAIKRKENAA